MGTDEKERRGNTSYILTLSEVVAVDIGRSSRYTVVHTLCPQQIGRTERSQNIIVPVTHAVRSTLQLEIRSLRGTWHAICYELPHGVALIYHLATWPLGGNYENLKFNNQNIVDINLESRKEQENIE